MKTKTHTHTVYTGTVCGGSRVTAAPCLVCLVNLNSSPQQRFNGTSYVSLWPGYTHTHHHHHPTHKVYMHNERLYSSTTKWMGKGVAGRERKGDQELGRTGSVCDIRSGQQVSGVKQSSSWVTLQRGSRVLRSTAVEKDRQSQIGLYNLRVTRGNNQPNAV